MDTALDSSKRQKVDLDPADTTPDAAGITWATRWSDLYILVPAGPPEEDGVVSLVRFPVHRAYACLFPLLEGILNHPGGSERRSIDMSNEGAEILQDSVTSPPEGASKVGWTAKHWLPVLEFAYEYKLVELPKPGTFVDDWMNHVGDDPSLETTHLLMYLCRLDLGCYLSENLVDYNPGCGGFALAFCLMHSVADASSLTIFKDSPALAGSNSGRFDLLDELASWLRGPGCPLRDGSIMAEPTTQQVKVCEWLLLTVATVDDSEASFWARFPAQMNGFADIARSIKLDSFASSWFCEFTSLLVGFAPCAVHMDYSTWAKEDAMRIMYTLHPQCDTHVSAFNNNPGTLPFRVDTGPFFAGVNIRWEWPRTDDGGRTTRNMQFRYHVHPIMKAWTLHFRGKHQSHAWGSTHIMVCLSCKLIPREVSTATVVE